MFHLNGIILFIVINAVVWQGLLPKCLYLSTWMYYLYFKLLYYTFYAPTPILKWFLEKYSLSITSVCELVF